MWNEPSSPTFLLVIAGSILAHVASLALLPAADAAVAPTPAPPILVSFEAAPPPPPPPAVVPVVEPPIAAARRPVARAPRPAVQQLATRPEAAVEDVTPPATTPPADFSGVTLTNEGAGWSTSVGDGGSMSGPIAQQRTPSPAIQRGRVATTPATSDRVVALGNLSRPPRAPNLDDRLAANYPREARLAGTGGSAVVRARILIDGRVGTTRVVSETLPGFGVACQRTLAGSRWQAPLDAHKAPVATDLTYTCTFAVAR
ncbi:MAG: Ferric siderophore transport system, periplasmic binding protein TonB [Myxococcales bacterium]|jgi:hypothetical protein|nr:Ferric siderophore transport system, periplasmic binding protein TonB [Myxococcales bacterium]